MSHIDELYPAVKQLMLMLFPEDYIVSHSISGKASNSQSRAKPPFDGRLFQVMINILKEKFDVTTKEITEKVHSVQKFIMKKKKQTEDHWS